MVPAMLTLQEIEERLENIARYIQPCTHARDRKGYKPNADMMGKAGMALASIVSEDDIRLNLVEFVGDDDVHNIQIREFSYTREELADIAASLHRDWLSGHDALPLQWSFFQISRALRVIDEVPSHQWGHYSSDSDAPAVTSVEYDAPVFH
jgi:hypothetical protein